MKKPFIFFVLLIAAAAAALLGFSPDLRQRAEEAAVHTFAHHHDEHESAAEHEHGDPHRHEAEHHHGEEDEHEAEHHHGDEDEHEAHETMVHLSDAALFNLGISRDKLITLTRTDYAKTFRIPGTIQEIPGRSPIKITSGAAGTITQIFAGQGEALCPGEALMEVRLAHEEAIQCQTELISLLQKHDILAMEEKRLGTLTEGVAPKAVRELQIQMIENQAAIQTQRKILEIHGFTEEQIDGVIAGERKTISALTERVPDADGTGIVFFGEEQHTGNDDHDHYLVLESLNTDKGASVVRGELLCTISDLRQLQIEGRAFASDENVVNSALVSQKPITAVFADPLQAEKETKIENLTLSRIDDQIDRQSQTISCWALLTNEKLPNHSGEKRIRWRFKPGQRCRLEIETETLRGVFVLPPESVAFDETGAYIFEMADQHEESSGWAKRPVRVLHRASDAVVILPDDTIKEGMLIAPASADQLLTATGGGGKLQSACSHDHSH